MNDTKTPIATRLAKFAFRKAKQGGSKTFTGIRNVTVQLYDGARQGLAEAEAAEKYRMQYVADDGTDEQSGC